jgi:membrane associated rhomboid family serine protease
VSNRKASLIAGLLAGITGLLVFLVIHHLWIKPIWFILPLGLVIAAAGGLAAGWAYSELLPGLPRRPWTIFALASLWPQRSSLPSFDHRFSQVPA